MFWLTNKKIKFSLRTYIQETNSAATKIQINAKQCVISISFQLNMCQYDTVPLPEHILVEKWL